MRALPTKNYLYRMIAICSLAAINPTHAIATDNNPKPELSIIPSSTECKLRVKRQGKEDQILTSSISAPCKFTRTQDTNEIVVLTHKTYHAFMVTQGDASTKPQAGDLSTQVIYDTKDHSYFTESWGRVHYAERLFKNDRTLIEWDKLFSYPLGNHITNNAVEMEKYLTHGKKAYYFIDDISQIAE